MRCAVCDKTETLLWAHNGGCDIHRWDDKEEKDCTCHPKLICAACEAPLLRDQGFVVLDAVCFGLATTTLQ